MSFIGDLLNSSKGAGFTAQSAPIVSPVTPTDVQQSIAASNQSLGSNQALAQALAQQGGIQNQSQVYNQLQGVANGTGPNPAAAQLNQATGQNVANQAALMAGQRGAGANAGLIARQAAQQGGALQQQAVGQGATMQANQALNAIGQAGQIAGQQVSNQIGQNQFNTGAQQNQQQQMIGAQLGAQGQQLQNVQQQNASNTAIAQGNQKTQSDLFGGLINGAGSGIKALAGMAEGGEVHSPIHSQFLMGLTKKPAMAMAEGGAVPALVSPGEKILTPTEAAAAKAGKMDPMAAATVPGTPKVGGAKNSYANDTVPMKLAVGSVVLPRDVTQAKDKDAKAKKFIETLKSKSKK